MTYASLKKSTGATKPLAGGSTSRAHVATRAPAPESLRIEPQNSHAEQEADRLSSLLTGDGGLFTPPPLPPSKPVQGDGGSPATPRFVQRLQRASLAAGDPLPVGVKGAAERALAIDLNKVRIHRDPEVTSLSRQIGARAFTHGSRIFLPREEGSLSRGEAHRILAHELVHVSQHQRSPSTRIPNTIYRYLTFSSGAAAAQHTRISPTGDEPNTRSRPLFHEFLDGLAMHLALTPRFRVSSGIYVVDRAEENKGRESAIRDLFRRAYSGGVAIQTARGGTRIIEAEEALLIWRFVRAFVRDVIQYQDKTPEHEVIAKNNVFVDTAPEDKGTPAAMLDRTFRERTFGLHGDHAQIDIDDMAGLAVSTASGWNGFWILVHELLHTNGYSPEKIGAHALGAALGVDRQITLADAPDSPPRAPMERFVSHLGDIEEILNIIRIPFGLPVRTAYADIEIDEEHRKLDRPDFIAFSYVTAPAGSERRFDVRNIGRKQGLVGRDEPRVEFHGALLTGAGSFERGLSRDQVHENAITNSTTLVSGRRQKDRRAEESRELTKFWRDAFAGEHPGKLDGKPGNFNLQIDDAGTVQGIFVAPRRRASVSGALTVIGGRSAAVPTASLTLTIVEKNRSITVVLTADPSKFEENMKRLRAGIPVRFTGSSGTSIEARRPL